MEVDYLLTSTRSVRKSLDLAAPVDLNEIRDCLRIGLQAANGSNQQSWRWLVVADPERRRAVADLYRDAYLSMTGGGFAAKLIPDDNPMRPILTSVEWLVQHLPEVPILVIPCYEQYLSGNASESFNRATLYGSIFPAVWNFQLALHTRGYGTCVTTLHLEREAEIAALLGIPESYVQGCLLPVGRLPAGRTFKPAIRRPLNDVVALDGWDGPSL